MFLALGLVVLAPFAVLPGLAQTTGEEEDAGLALLSPAAQSRLIDAPAIARALAQGEAANVIVEFALPSHALPSHALPPGVSDSGIAADRARSAAIHAQQDRILARALSVAGGAASPGGDPRADLPTDQPAPPIRRMDVSPMFVISADRPLLEALAADPEVVRIHPNGLRAQMLNRSTGVIGMPATHAAGATGAGQVIAVIDAGVRLSHEHLSGRVVEGACFNLRGAGSTSRCPGGGETAFGLPAGDDCTDPAWRGCGHGTHVASIAAGFVAAPGAGVPAHGVARDARLMSLNVFSRFGRDVCGLPQDSAYSHCLLSFDSDQILALEHVYARRHAHRIAAVNMSLGGGRHVAACEDAALRPIIQRLVRAGIAVIVAAGNEGHDDAVAFPACVPEAIAVAGSDAGDRRSSSSNWGRLVDLVAPGSSIRAAYVSGNANNHYRALSGTSMATPHVAGAFAAIRSVRPDAAVDTIRDALAATGTLTGAAGRSVPRINVSAALDRLSLPTTTRLSAPSVVQRGQPVQVLVAVSATSGIPRGPVRLEREGVQIAARMLEADGQARFILQDLPVGASRLMARFPGHGGFAGSASGPLTVTVAEHPVGQGFLGGGVVFGLTEGCRAAFGSRPHAVTIRYSPSELDAPPSSLSLVWPEGSEQLTLWGPMSPSAAFLGGAGRQSWSRFAFYPRRPLLRVVARAVTMPPGAALRDARELILRLRVQNFGAIPGCAATVVASLRRA